MKYDLIVIGLGPAGMSASYMAAELGLKVLGIEKRYIGGECMNVGCIPSKALLRMGKYRHYIDQMKFMELTTPKKPKTKHPFKKINEELIKSRIAKEDMLKKITISYEEAKFINKNTIQYGKKIATGKHIFIATGTDPLIPPIVGINKIPILTNQNLFSLKKIPKTMIIIGGGAIGSEMAQAFSRLGTKVTIINLDEHLIPFEEKEATHILQDSFIKEGIKVHNSTIAKKVHKKGKFYYLQTNKGTFKGEQILVVAGRKILLDKLNLGNAGIIFDKHGIKVNKYLQTNKKNVYAIGDCNGRHLFSHAAMHQAMIAVINAITPIKYNFEKYLVPNSIFTEPEISLVGNMNGKIIKTEYKNYGGATYQGFTEGYVKVAVSKTGRILGATIIGEGASEMINEWTLAIQKKLKITDVMFTQHTFPSMSYLNQRVAQEWMMKRIPWIRKYFGRFFH